MIPAFYWFICNKRYYRQIILNARKRIPMMAHYHRGINIADAIAPD